MKAGELEEIAAEEKEVEEIDEERKGERIGSLENDSKGDEVDDDGAVVMGRRGIFEGWIIFDWDPFIAI